MNKNKLAILISIIVVVAVIIVTAIMLFSSNFGSTRVGVFTNTNPLANWYWSDQWTVNYITADGTITRNVKLTDDELSAFYVRSESESGIVVLQVSQGDVIKEIDFSGVFNEMIDMSGFDADENIKLVLELDSVRNLKAVIGWRR